MSLGVKLKVSKYYILRVRGYEKFCSPQNSQLWASFDRRADLRPGMS